MAIIELLKALRPQQWVKNILVFAALIFSQNLFETELLVKTILVFVIFCLISSAVYLFNDLKDLEKDKQHPEKKQRPLAAGRVNLSLAFFLAVILAVVGLAASFYLDLYLSLIIALYLIINLLYSSGFKNFPILDVLLVSTGFLLRVIAGAIIINVDISYWLLIATFLLALFVSFGKRRHELILLETDAINHRSNLKEYSIPFLDQMITIVTAATIVVYMLYTVSEDVILKVGNDYLLFTSIFVIYGIFRYLYLIHKNKNVGSPIKAFLTDKGMLINSLLWILSVIVIIYFL